MKQSEQDDRFPRMMAALKSIQEIVNSRDEFDLATMYAIRGLTEQALLKVKRRT